MTRYLASQSGTDFRAQRLAVREADRSAASSMPPTARSFEGRLYQVQKDAVSRFVRDHPARVVLLSLTEMADQLRAPGDRVFQVIAHRKLWWSGPLGSLLVAGLFGLALYGGYRRWRDGEPRPSLLTAGVLLFFLVTGSVSHLSGSRLRFPADLVSIPLTAIGFAGLIDRNARGVRLRSGT